MIGGSYGGQVQFAAAGLDHRDRRTHPDHHLERPSYSLAPNNTSFDHGRQLQRRPACTRRQWTSLFFGVGIADGIQGIRDRPEPQRRLPELHRPGLPAKAQLDSLGCPTRTTIDFARHASVTSYMHDVSGRRRCSVQGQKDTLFNLQEAAATYRAMQAQGTAVR